MLGGCLWQRYCKHFISVVTENPNLTKLIYKTVCQYCTLRLCVLWPLHHHWDCFIKKHAIGQSFVSVPQANFQRIPINIILITVIKVTNGFLYLYWVSTALMSTAKLALVAHVILVTTYSKAHGANMGPTWVLPYPGGTHVGPMNLAIWDIMRIVVVADHHNGRDPFR